MRAAAMRSILAALAALLVWPAPARAEWQLKPFVGVTFGGDTTFVDLEHASGHPNLALGISGTLIGDILGVEGDFGHAPGFFQKGDQQLVLTSGVTTLTANVVAAVPRHLAQYTLRPYAVAGGGLMHVHSEDIGGGLIVSRNLAAMDVGGGVTGFLTNRIGLSWDLRYFKSLGGTGEPGLSFGAEELSFWRGSMALAIRF